MPSPELGSGHETARVYNAHRRRGGSVADCSTGAAACDAGDRVPQQCVARAIRPLVAAFHQGLKETGFVEAQNVAIEYRWAEGQHDRLSSLAADLVRREGAGIVCFGGNFSAPAAKAATTTIPIIFAMGGDPVEFGLVASLNRPGGNITGV